MDKIFAYLQFIYEHIKSFSNYLFQFLKSRNKYFYIIFSSILLIFIIIFFVYYYVFSETDIKNISKKDVYVPLYVKKIESIEKSYYKNIDFVNCVSEESKNCFKTHFKKDINFSGSLLQIVNKFSSYTRSELLDNCIGDNIGMCYEKSIKNLANAKPSEDLCKAYSDQVSVSNCLKDMYIKIAIYKDNISICDKNIDTLDKLYCQDQYNQNKSIKDKNIGLCDNLSDDFTKKICRDNFYFSVALSINDIKYCENAPSKDAVSNCVQNYLSQKLNTKSINNCEEIKGFDRYLKSDEVNNFYKRCHLEKLNEDLSKLNPIKDKEAYIALCNKFEDKIFIKDCIKKTEEEKTAISVIPETVDKTMTEKLNNTSGSLSPEDKKKN